MDIRGLAKKYVRGTEKKAIVQFVTILLCRLPATVVRAINLETDKVYVNARVIKHAYDKRPAEEFDALIADMFTIVKYPDKIYRNKAGKRGSLCFVKTIKNTLCLCSIESSMREETTVLDVVTVFRTDEDYLARYELLWEWKGGGLHRSAFDSGDRPNSAPQ